MSKENCLVAKISIGIKYNNNNNKSYIQFSSNFNLLNFKKIG